MKIIGKLSSVRKALMVSGILSSCFMISAQEFAWFQKKHMLHACVAPSACTYDGKIYIFGGDVNGHLGKIDGGDSFLQVYDMQTDSWSEKKRMPMEIWMHGAVLVDSIIYVIGGGWSSALNTNYAYNPNTDEWTEKAAMHRPRGGLGVCALDGKIYAIGGFSDGMAVGTNDMYDPKTDTWTIKARMPTVRIGLAVVAAGGKIYAIGGTQYYLNAYDEVEVYDPAADKWSKLSPMNSSRFGVAAAVIKNRIIAMGGTSSSKSLAQSAVEIYNIQTNHWQTIEDLPVATQWATACADSNSVFIIGGENKCALTFDDAIILSAFNELKITGITDIENYSCKSDKSQIMLSPNPVKTNLEITYYLEKEGLIKISIYNASGILISEIINNHEFKGTHALSMDLSGQTSGVYVCRAILGSNSFAKELIIRR